MILTSNTKQYFVWTSVRKLFTCNLARFHPSPLLLQAAGTVTAMALKNLNKSCSSPLVDRQLCLNHEPSSSAPLPSNGKSGRRSSAAKADLQLKVYAIF